MPDVLLVEDDSVDAALVCRLLGDSAESSFTITHVTTIKAALERLAAQAFHAVLLDLNLPDSRNPETIDLVMVASPGLPIIVVSGHDDEATAIDAVRAGAQDYIIKDDMTNRLLGRTIRYAIERKEMEQELARLALHDELTGLPTRTLLYDRWTSALARAKRSGSWLGILVLDLNGFKAINDQLGHAAGDFILQTTADRLLRVVRRNDTVARVGGDEFVVLLENIRGLEEASSIAGKIETKVAEAVHLRGEIMRVTTSIGMAVTRDGQPDDFISLLNRADLEMYEQKRSQKSAEAIRQTG